jgi:hypothetical protein
MWAQLRVELRARSPAGDAAERPPCVPGGERPSGEGIDAAAERAACADSALVEDVVPDVVPEELEVLSVRALIRLWNAEVRLEVTLLEGTGNLRPGWPAIRCCPIRSQDSSVLRPSKPWSP